ncbi:hypothetical protein Q7P35_004358 [Cladosporium inversicolor]
MAFSPVAWWTRDTALHTYIYAQVLISLPFSVFGTYVTYQLQIAGMMVGDDGAGGPCMTFCIIEWAGSRLDLNAILLYMNAFGVGLGGLVTLILSAYSDYWSKKHLMVTLLFVLYGIICISVYWLQGISGYNFQVLSGLSIAFTITTSILVAVLNIYVPYCMRTAATSSMKSAREDANVVDQSASKKRTYGFLMSIKGAFANSIGALVMYIIVIIITQTTMNVQSPGLLVTSIIGFVTIAASAVTFMGLSRIPAKDSSVLKHGILRPVTEFLAPFRDLSKRRSMAVLLISFTIYTDTTYAISSVTSQLFILELLPGTLEISLYALASTISGVICSVGFMALRPHVPIRLETWLLIGYGIMILIPVWGAIGFANVSFGFKLRWEFYVQTLLITLSGVVCNTCFRVLFSEMMPPRNEVRWFGLQYVLSCATVWVNYIASAPLQNATHQLRFPLILSLIFMVIAFILEFSRLTVPFFQHDQEKWAAHDKAALLEETRDQSVASEEAPIGTFGVQQVDGSVISKR